MRAPCIILILWTFGQRQSVGDYGLNSKHLEKYTIKDLHLLFYVWIFYVKLVTLMDWQYIMTIYYETIINLLSLYSDRRTWQLLLHWCLVTTIWISNKIGENIGKIQHLKQYSSCEHHRKLGENPIKNDKIFIRTKPQTSPVDQRTAPQWRKTISGWNCITLRVTFQDNLALAISQNRQRTSWNIRTVDKTHTDKEQLAFPGKLCIFQWASRTYWTIFQWQPCLYLWVSLRPRNICKDKANTLPREQTNQLFTGDRYTLA